MFEELIKLDKELLLFLNGLGTPFWDGFWIYLSRTLSFVTITIYTLVIYYSYRYFGLKNTLFVLSIGTLLILGTEQLSIFSKENVGRLRPCYDEHIKESIRVVKSYCGGMYGYFSAHAANSSAFASFFGLLFYRKNRFLITFILLWALLVSYSRIYIGVHFPLDVLTGIFVGVLGGVLFNTLYQKTIGYF